MKEIAKPEILETKIVNGVKYKLIKTQKEYVIQCRINTVITPAWKSIYRHQDFGVTKLQWDSICER